MEHAYFALDVVSWVLLASGSFFLVVGGIGLIRLPDFYARTHAAGVIDTLGTGLILIGLILQTELGINTFKLVLIGFFIFFTSPTASYAVAHSAWVAGQRPRTSGPASQQDPKQGDS